MKLSEFMEAKYKDYIHERIEKRLKEWDGPKEGMQPHKYIKAHLVCVQDEIEKIVAELLSKSGS